MRRLFVTFTGQLSGEGKVAFRTTVLMVGSVGRHTELEELGTLEEW
jgi:hypothetical protein